MNGVIADPLPNGHGGAQASPSDVVASDPVTFRPNEETFWKALDRVSISVPNRGVVGDPSVQDHAQVCDEFIQEYVLAFLDDYCGDF